MVNGEGIAQHVVESAEKAVLDELVTSLPAYDSSDIARFNTRCAKAALLLPSSIVLWVNQVRQMSVGLLRGLPLPLDLPATPNRKGLADSFAMPSDSLLGLIAACLGEIVSFEGKVCDRQIHNVYPAEDEVHGQLGASSGVLDWHVEDAFHPDRAEWLAILCLRGAPDALTYLARARDLSLAESDWLEMRHRPATLVVDESFCDGYRGRPFRVAMVTGPSDHFELSYDPSYTDLKDHNIQALLGRISVAAEAAKFSINLKAGDLLILDNRRVIHSRSALRANFDGRDRWIKRALIAETGRKRCFLQPGMIAFPS